MAKKTNTTKISPKEVSLAIIINLLHQGINNLHRENLIAAMHDLGFENFSVRTGGFETILENFELNRERALTKAVNLLEGRGFDLDKIKELDMGFYLDEDAHEEDGDEEEEEENDDEEDEEEAPAPKKSSKKAAPAKKSKKVVEDEDEDEEEEEEEAPKKSKKAAPAKKGKKGKK